MRRLRAILPGLVATLVLGAMAGFAWISNHPDAAWLEQAEEWPLVGPLAHRLRLAYLPQLEPPEPAAGVPSAEAGPPVGQGLAALPPVGDVSVLAAAEEVWLEPGNALRAVPEATAPVALELAAYVNAPVLERRGDWAEVVYRGHRGWTLAPPEAPRPPPLGSSPEPPRPLPGRAPESSRLERAVAAMGVAGPGTKLGPYPLYTDVADDGLLRWLEGAVKPLESLYTQRYGQRPVGEAAEALVLFADHGDYRRFKESEASLVGLAAAGHAGHGLATTFVGHRDRTEVVATLAHEVTHLLNRRALGPALPPWLDEGLAGDLGSVRFDPVTGRPEVQQLGGRVERSGRRLDFHGARADLHRLREMAQEDRLTPLPELLAQDWESFVAGEGSTQLRYAQAAFFVRYLLTAEGGALAEPFRAFLADVAAGEPPSGEALLAHLGRSWPQLELGLRFWLRFLDDAQSTVLEVAQ